ncbi:MAG: 3-phosphoshikimate 1-carboxyvinyltransferase, partial [bacterium]|nr:3-phosphoshikimate 1-carboxyvinyltransferase [bacterium]
MKKEIQPTKDIGGVIRVPGDKSIAHRAALLSIVCDNPVQIVGFPQGSDCRASLEAARKFGVTVEKGDDGSMTLTPPDNPGVEPETIIDCGNSGTTARLLSGLASGLKVEVIIAGDDSLSERPMKRIVDPLTEMGAELFDKEGHLPLKISGRKLLPFEYRLPVPSAQVKSSLLLAGLASQCSVTVQEPVVTRDHTERMIAELGGEIAVREIKPVREEDPL